VEYYLENEADGNKPKTQLFQGEKYSKSGVGKLKMTENDVLLFLLHEGRFKNLLENSQELNNPWK